MATNTGQQQDLPAATAMDISYLWHLMSEDFIIGFGETPQFEGRLSTHSCLGLSYIPSADMNFALIFGGSDPEIRLREYHHVMATAEVPAIVVLSGAVAEGLAPIAESLGLTGAGTAPMMVCRPDRPPIPSGDYAVERVHDIAGCEAALELSCRAFHWSPDVVRQAFPLTILDLPGFACFLARRDDDPRSAVMTLRHGPYVGIYNMATPPEHQRRGAGRALLEYAIADYMARGATTFFLVATEQGYPLYQRIGFTTVDQPAIWLSGTSTQFS